MKKLIVSWFICLGIVSIISFSRRVSAQGVSSMPRSMEESVKKKTIKWFLEHKEVKDNTVAYRWYDKDKIVSIHIIETASVEAATVMLNQERLIYNNPSKTKLTEYGDEVYLYKAGGGSDKANILIRQGKYFVSIYADRLKDAKEFAKETCEMVKAAKPTK
jgi:hypothetical protein